MCWRHITVWRCRWPGWTWVDRRTGSGLLSFIPYVGSITGGVGDRNWRWPQFPACAACDRDRRILVVGQILKLRDLSPSSAIASNCRSMGYLPLFRRRAAFGLLGRDARRPGRSDNRVLCRFCARYLSSPLYLTPRNPRAG